MTIDKLLAEPIEYQHAMFEQGQPINSPESVSVIREKIPLGIVTAQANLYKADQVIDPTPIILLKGFGADAEAYADLGHETSLRGRNLLVMETNRLECPLNDQLVTQAKVAWTGMKWYMRNNGDTLFDAYGHSMGWGAVTELARGNADWLRSATAAGGVGQDGHYGLLHRIKGLGRCMGKEIVPERNNLLTHDPGAMAKGELRHIFGGLGLVLLLAEGLNTAPYDARPGIEEAKQLNPRLRVGAINFGRDAFFNHDEIEAESGDLHDKAWLIPHATHVHPITHSDEHSSELILSSAELNQPVQLQVAS